MSKKLIAGAGVVASFAIALAPLATFATTPAAGSEYVSQLDKLSVTIEPYCSFGFAFKDGSTTTAHGSHTSGTTGSTAATTIKDTTTYPSATYGAGNGKWTSTELSPVVSTAAPDTAPETAYGVMENGTYNLEFAKTTLTVVCNNRAGYSITASSEALTDDANAVSDTFAQTAAAPTGAASTWSFQFQKATGFALNNRTLTGSAGSDAAWLSATAEGGLEVAHMAPTTTGEAQSQNPSAATTAAGDSYDATYAVGVSPTMPAGTYSGEILYTLAQL